jgi:hypothetical protein
MWNVIRNRLASLALVAAVLGWSGSAGAIVQATTAAGGGEVWTYGACTRVDDDTVSVVDNAANVAAFRVGIPMRFADAIGTWRYAAITTVTDAGATLTLDLWGEPATAAFDTYCQHGQASLMAMTLDVTDPGWGSDGIDAALLLHDLLWIYPPSKTVTRHLIGFCVRPITDDTGAAQPAVTPYIGGVAASTALTVTDAAWTCTTSATIDPAQSTLAPGAVFEVGTNAAGTNDDTSNYTFQVTWVLEG